MDDFSKYLIARAPLFLIAVAVAMVIGGALNTVSTWSLLTNNPDFQGSTISYLWGAVFGIFYQPAILLAWAAAIQYLSIIAGRRI